MGSMFLVWVNEGDRDDEKKRVQNGEEVWTVRWAWVRIGHCGDVDCEVIKNELKTFSDRLLGVREAFRIKGAKNTREGERENWSQPLGGC